jgi:ADP-heptose:LPS heptosyltransferase
MGAVDTEAGTVVLHPGAAARDRLWPTPKWAAVAAALHHEGHQVVVTGGRDETSLTSDVVQRAGLPADRDLGGLLSIVALAGLISSARLLLSSDTGVAHLATAYGTASVVLFGHVPPREWGPAIDLHRHACLRNGPVLASIDTEPVLDAARRLLETCRLPVRRRAAR